MNVKAQAYKTYQTFIPGVIKISRSGLGYKYVNACCMEAN